jgi:hypothetical protein
MTERRPSSWLPLLSLLACVAASGCKLSPAPDDAPIDAAISADGALDSAPGDDGPSPSIDAGDATVSPPPHVDAGPDADTCGVCPGTCFGARCMVVLASAQFAPGMIALSSQGVVWVNNGQVDTDFAEFAVMMVGLDGGQPTTIAPITGGDYPMALAGDDTTIIWTHAGDIVSVPTTPGSTPSTLAAGVGATFLAMDDAGIYWTTTASSPLGTATVWRMDRDGGAPASLMHATGTGEEVLAYGGAIYWQAYDANGAGDAMFAVGTDGSNPTTLVAGLGNPHSAWAVDSSGVYWGTNYIPLQISRVALDGGTPVVVATELRPTGMTADSTTIYFTNDNSVYEMPTDGGAPVAVAWRLPSPAGIAVDDESIYWTDVGTCDGGFCTGEVLKLTPK